MIHVVLGAPCSGKSTFVQENRKPGDVVIDFDKMAQAFGNDEKHAPTDAIKAVTFKARDAAISEVCEKQYEAWIIHSSPSQKQRDMYSAAGAEYIEMDTDLETCLARCEADNRPEGTADIIRQFFTPKGRKPMIKTKTFEVKADNGTISGYASTWTREPDSYGDVVAKGAFKESIEKIKAENRVLPLLFNHDGANLSAYIGTVYNLEEDDHGLKFDGAFDDTAEAQRARQLASDGRLAKFSFAYDVLDQGEVTLEDGRKANELRKLDIHEVSLVLYPANPDTSVISVKNEGITVSNCITTSTGTAMPSWIYTPTTTTAMTVGVETPEIKSGRRNSAKDAEAIRDAITLLQGVLGELEDIPATEEETNAKAEEPDTVNAEEQERIQTLLKEANEILRKDH